MINVIHFIKKTIACYFLFGFLSVSSVCAFQLFTDHKSMTPEQNIEYWQKRQIDKYDDPIVNYNLGVALYKAGKFDTAKQNTIQLAQDIELDLEGSMTNSNWKILVVDDEPNNLKL